MGGTCCTMEQTSDTRPIGLLRECYDWMGTLVGTIFIILFLFTFILRTVSVDGPSMMNTLQNGDHLILFEMGYTPKAGDIVVLYTKAEKQPIIKRVIATAGQTVDINYQTHTVKVDGHTLSEPYIREPTAFEGILPVNMPAKVPAGHIFVMGDNRNNSYDSRSSAIGMVTTRDVLGHAILRLFPNPKVLQTADIAVP